MEIAQLCKSTFNNKLQQTMYLCNKRNMSQIWWTDFGRVKVKGHIMMHNYTPLTNVHTKCQTSTPYRIQEIARQDFKTHGHYDKVKGQSKVTQ